MDYAFTTYANQMHLRIFEGSVLNMKKVVYDQSIEDMSFEDIIEVLKGHGVEITEDTYEFVDKVLDLL